MSQMFMAHDIDPAKEIWGRIGTLKDVDIYFGNILVAIYKRPEKTASGLFLSDKTRDEDKYQGKVGLVVKKGPMAFKDDENTKFEGQNVAVNDWVVFRPSDGWPWSIGKEEFRLLRDVDIKARIAAPDSVW
jgi:co-chaperonin GroES (HSP10)